MGWKEVPGFLRGLIVADVLFILSKVIWYIIFKNQIALISELTSKGTIYLFIAGFIVISILGCLVGLVINFILKNRADWIEGGLIGAIVLGLILLGTHLFLVEDMLKMISYLTFLPSANLGIIKSVSGSIFKINIILDFFYYILIGALISLILSKVFPSKNSPSQ